MASGAVEREVMRLGTEPEPSIVLVGDDGRLRFANARARMDLEAGDLFRQDGSGRVVLASPSAQEAFGRMRQTLATSRVPLTMDIRSGGEGVTLRMLPFDPDHLQDWGMGVYLGLEQRSLALIASRRDDRASEPALRLVAAYGLTHAEAQVARLLAEGLSLREIALSRETAYNTVRGQVKTWPTS